MSIFSKLIPELGISNFFLKKKACYNCDTKKHVLYIREMENYLELLCKNCIKHKR